MRDLIYCGRKLGTYENWDELGDDDLGFLGFIPVKELWDTPEKHTISLFRNAGLVEFYDDDGNVLKSVELILKFPGEA